MMIMVMREMKMMLQTLTTMTMIINMVERKKLIDMQMMVGMTAQLLVTRVISVVIIFVNMAIFCTRLQQVFVIVFH